MSPANRDSFDDLPILAELRDLLETRFTDAEHQARTARRRWLPNRSRSTFAAGSAVVAALAAVAIAVAALTLLRSGNSSQSQGSSPGQHSTKPTPSQLGYVDRAHRTTIARDPACVPRANQGVTFTHGKPSNALLATLGVLRRPAPPADETNRTLIQSGFDVGAGVYVNYIRRARTEFNKSFYIIPEARTTPFSPIPSRCYTEMHAALLHEIRQLARTQQARIFQLQALQFAAQRALTEHRDGFCFAAVSLDYHSRFTGVDSGGCSQGPPTLKQYWPTDPGWMQEDLNNGDVLLAGVVPDGVTAVTVHYVAGNGHPARTITSTIINNVAAFEIPPGTFRKNYVPTTVVWRAADGRVLRTFNDFPGPSNKH